MAHWPRAKGFGKAKILECQRQEYFIQSANKLAENETKRAERERERADFLQSEIEAIKKKPRSWRLNPENGEKPKRSWYSILKQVWISLRETVKAQRRRLQSNGTPSAKQLLCKVSGREARHVEHVNHQISKEIVDDAKKAGASVIVLEDLTNIRKNIRAGKRVRSRLHCWSFRELQGFIAYKAEAVGITVYYKNPAYSVTCCGCLSVGERNKHQFKCSSCGLLAHADCNASRNLARIVGSAESTRASVDWPNVGTFTCVP